MAGCVGGSDDDGHDDGRWKNAREIYFCKVVIVGESTDGADVHVGIGDELFQLWKAGGIVVTNELRVELN